MDRFAMWGAIAALALVAACSKQPDAPAATAIVIPASAPLTQVPSAGASDASLPSAAVVASQPASTAGPEAPTGSPNPPTPPDVVPSSAASAAAMPSAPAASQP